MTAETTTAREGLRSKTGRRMCSVEATRAVWESRANLTKTELLMLQALASHADQNFECYPSMARLALMTRISKRQAIRVIDSLQKKGLISVAENAGGRHKCNRYRLLVSVNGDIGNSDTRKGDTGSGDILNANSDISDPKTVTLQRGNGVTAMSPEWVEGVKAKGNKGGRTSPRNYEKAFSEIADMDPEELYREILAGPSVQKNEVCEEHGGFVRVGYRWRDWIAWAGHQNLYSSGWSHDSGCPGCLKDHIEFRESKPIDRSGHIPLRQFELETPAFCPDHGNFTLKVNLSEYTQEYAQLANRSPIEVTEECAYLCPGCEGQWMHEANVQHQLELTNEEWERGGREILKALDIAYGTTETAPDRGKGTA